MLYFIPLHTTAPIVLISVDNVCKLNIFPKLTLCDIPCKESEM